MNKETADRLLNGSPRDRYQMLSRMQSDCKYYLGHGGRNPKNLWAGNVQDQIAYMKMLWDSFPEDGKPEWLDLKQIDAYAVNMLSAVRANGSAPAFDVENGPIRGVLIPSYGDPFEIDIARDADGSTLQSLQAIVGGWIEPFDVLFKEGISLYVNEEGIYSCPPNRAVYATKDMEEDGYLSGMDFTRPAKEGELYTVLFGDIAAVGFDPETGENRSLTAEESSIVCDYFTKVSGINSGVKEIVKLQSGNDRGNDCAPDKSAPSLAEEAHDMKEASEAINQPPSPGSSGLER